MIQLPTTRSGYIGCLVVIDHFSKWLTVVPIKNKRAQTVVSVLEHRILPGLPGKPQRLLTDNGSEFASEVFNNVLNLYGIKHSYSSPYKPACNGAVERANRTISELLRCLVEEAGMINLVKLCKCTTTHTIQSVSYIQGDTPEVEPNKNIFVEPSGEQQFVPNASEFSGFDIPLPEKILLILNKARQRHSLSPLQQCISESHQALLEFIRRSRDRLHALHRSILAHQNSDVELALEPVGHRYPTRSKGPLSEEEISSAVITE